MLIFTGSSHSVAPVTLRIIITWISQVGHLPNHTQNRRVPETVSLNWGLHDSSLPHQEVAWADGIKQQIQDKQKTVHPHSGIPFVVVQSISRLWLYVTPRTAACQGFLVLHYLPEFAQTRVHWINSAIQPPHPQLTPSPFAFNLSSIMVFSNESALCIR